MLFHIQIQRAVATVFRQQFARRSTGFQAQFRSRQVQDAGPLAVLGQGRASAATINAVRRANRRGRT